MNIYVADFVRDREAVPYKYRIPDVQSNVWFDASHFNVKKINAGDIVVMTNDNGSVIHKYLVACRDYEVGSGADVDTLRLPFSINSQGCKAPGSVNIWDSCVPDNDFANLYPWSFRVAGMTNEYIALVWHDRYASVGDFTLTVLNTPENRALFKEDRYVHMEKSKKIMIIEKVKANKYLSKNTDFLEVSGRSLESILDRRVAFPGMGLNTIEDKGQNGLINALYRVIDNYFVHPENLAKKSSDGNKTLYYPDRKIDFLNQTEVLAHKDNFIRRPFNAPINTTISKKDILSVVTDYCKEYNLGFEVVAKPRYGNSYAYEWNIRFYTGSDKSYDRADKSTPPLILSPKLRNVNNVSSSVDMANYKNSVFCVQEKETTTYIDISQVNEISLGSGVIGTIANNLIKSIREKFVDGVVSYTAALILAVAANRRDKGYTFTVTDIAIEGEDGETPTTITYWDYSKEGKDFRVNYPVGPISKAEAELITITYKQSFGSDIGSSKTGTVKLSDVEGFLSSTAYGWLVPVILSEATAAANALNENNWKTSSIDFIKKLSKKAITGLFSLMSTFTSSTTLNEWLCETYDREDGRMRNGGLNRREVIVERKDEDDGDWDTSASNSWAMQTTVVKETTVKDEESDEEISKKLRDSARKGVGKYSVKHEVDVEIDSVKIKYGEDYELGDILQVDDNSGETSKVIVTEVEYDDDQKNPNKTIPTFVKYESIPSAYIKLEYLTFAQMLLPVIFDEENTSYTNVEDCMGRYGSAVEPPYENGNDAQAYNGFIESIKYQKTKKWTEFELEAAYMSHIDEQGKTTELNPSFALLSAVGFRVQDGNSVNRFIRVGAPLCLVSTSLETPLMTGLTGFAYEYLVSSGEISRIPTLNDRNFYMFLGDEYGEDNLYSPGFAIKPDTLFDLSGDYLNHVYKQLDNSEFKKFVVNRPFAESGEPFMSQTYIENASRLLQNRPQYSRKYRYDSARHLYLQTSGYSKYIGTDADFVRNPWHQLNKPGQNIWKTPDVFSAVSGSHGLILSEGSLNDFEDVRPEQLAYYGAYGQTPTARTRQSTDNGNLIVQNMGQYRYVALGGQPVANFISYAGDGMRASLKNVDGLTWPNQSIEYTPEGSEESKKEIISLNDTINGITFKSLDVYEYESSFKVYRWSDFKKSALDPVEITDQNTHLLDDILRTTNAVYKTHVITNVSGEVASFYPIEAAFEEPIIETRRLVHRYKPVKYNAEGSDDLKDVEKYGLFDEVEMTFIPLNYNPFRNVAGLTGENTNATFIRSGGELVNE